MFRSLQKRYRYAIVVSVFISVTLLVGVLAFFVLRAMGRELGCSMTVAYGWGGATGLFRAHMDAHPEKKYPPMSAMPGNLFPALESMKHVMDPSNSYTLHCSATAGGAERCSTRTPILNHFAWVASSP